MYKNILSFLIIISILILPVASYDRITQGSNVYLNETVDISGVTGWADAIAYYDSSSFAGEPSYILKLPPIMKQTHFYIDPSIFEKRGGYWFQYYGNTSDDHGNSDAFKVITRTRNNSYTFENGTIITNNSYIVEEKELVETPPPVNPKHIADQIVARGEELNIKTTTSAKVWIFGKEDGIYNRRSIGGSAYFNISEVYSLQPDDYTVIIQYPGQNGEFNSVYDDKKRVLKTLVTTVDGWNTSEKDVSIYTPTLLKEKVIESIEQTDDVYNVILLNVADPYIQITSRDNIDKGSTGIMIVSGYTNVAAGTQLNFTIDDVKFVNSRIKNITTTPALSTKTEGDLRYFVAHVLFGYEELSVGTHFITGRTPLGGAMTVEFHVYDNKDSELRKNSTTKYIGGNEFIPTPTPEIIKVIETQIVERVVTKVVVEQLTPNIEQLNKAQNDAAWNTAYTIIGVVAVLLLAGYVLSVGWRGSRKQ